MSHRSRPPVTRREALCRIGSGFGMMAFAGLVSRSLSAAELAQSDAVQRLYLGHGGDEPSKRPVAATSTRKLTRWTA